MVGLGVDYFIWESREVFLERSFKKDELDFEKLVVLNLWHDVEKGIQKIWEQQKDEH